MTNPDLPADQGEQLRLLRRSEAILQAVCYAGEQLLEADHWEEVIDGILQRLGRAAGADRALLIRNRVDDRGQVHSSCRFEWASDGTPSVLEEPAMQDIRWQAVPQWADRLAGGRVVQGVAEDLAPDERAAMSEYGLTAVLLAPILVAREWWGVIGLGAIERPVRWSSGESEAMRAAAASIGSAVDRQRSVGALADSERRLKQVVDSTFDIIFQIDLEGHHTFANQAAQRVTGYSLTELLNMHMRELVAPDHQARVAERLRRRITGEELPQPFVFEIVRKDGRRVHVELTTAPIREDGRLIGVEGIARNVTQRVLADRALRRRESRERRFRDLLTRLHEVTVELSTVSCVDELCRRAVELGRSRLGFDRLGLWFRPDLPGWCSEAYSVDERGDIRREDGSEIWARGQPMIRPIVSKQVSVAVKHNSPIFDGRGRPVGEGSVAVAGLWDGTEVIGVLAADNLLGREPITPDTGELLRLYALSVGHLVAGVRAGEALRQQEERFRTLVENTNDIFYVADAEGRLEYVGPQIAHLGFEAAEMVGHNLLEYIHPEDRERVAADFGRSMKEGEEFPTEFRILPDERGGFRWFQDRGRIRRDDQGRISGINGILRDITERKRMEEALRESEALARALLDAAPERALLIDRDYRVFDLNEPAAAGLDGTREEIIGRTIPELISPELTRSRRVIVERAFSEGRPITFEDERAGRILHNTLYPIADASGRISRMAIYGRDVTERRRAERALKQQLELFQTLLDTIPSPVFYKDGELRYIGCNTAYEKYTGLSREQLRGMTVHDVETDPSLAQVYHAHDVALLAGAGSFRYEDAVISPRGQQRRVILNKAVFRGPDGDPAGIVGVILDITERIRAEQALRESEEKYRVLVESAGEAISVVDDGGRFLFLNGTAAERLGGRPEEFVGKKMWDLFPRATADRQAESVRKVIESGRGRIFDTSTVIRGRRRWYRTSIQPLREESGGCRRALVIARDVTEAHEAEAELRDVHRRLMTIQEEQRQHLSSELHDSVGQCLVALQMNLKSLKPAAEDDPQADRLRRAGELCEVLTERVSRLSRWLYPAPLESMGLATGLEQIASDFQGQADVRIECAKACRSHRFSPDVEIALYRIAQEAVSNAVRHAPGATIEVELKCPRGRPTLAVTDNGPGFDPDRVRGHGLGLRTMQERAEAVGGELTITSEPGRTRVRAVLPAGEPDGDKRRQ
jgi:PAS domain S-box-containing protein